MVRRNKTLMAMLGRWAAKLCALVVALFAFVLFTYAKQETREVTIPVSVLMPQSLEAVSTVPQTVDVRIKGEGDVVYLIDPEMIHATLDYSQVSAEGIATMPVTLTFEQGAMEDGSIALEADPGQCRVMFQVSQN